MKVSRNSLISWSGDLHMVEIRPFFNRLNLCCECRSEELFANGTNSWHQECVRKLLEHRFWVSLGLFGVTASDFEKSLISEIRVCFASHAHFQKMYKISSHDPKKSQWHLKSMLQELSNALLISTVGAIFEELFRLALTTKEETVEKWSSFDLVEVTASRDQRISRYFDGQ